MVVGIATVAVLSHRNGYRLGGVMVLPLLAIYTFREPLSPLIFVAGTAAAWGALWIVREYTLNHGRRVFLVAVLTGAFATILAAHFVATVSPVSMHYDDAAIVASIFPGIAAYNLMRLDGENRLADGCLMVVVFAGLVIVGVAGLELLEGRPLPTPPVLALQSSDLVSWLGIDTRGEAVARITPNWLSVTLLVIDVSIYEFVRKRYDFRLAGIIVIPLIAVFSVRLEYVTGLFAIGATAVYFLISSIHWLTLLYGRVLLGISLILGSLYALALGGLTPTRIPGLSLFFLGLIVGIAAYNLYRTSPRLRSASLRISAGLFVVFYAILLVFVDVPAGGLFSDAHPAYAILGVVVLALAALELSRLERSRPSLAEFARASVFSEGDLDGSDTAASPFVDESGGPAAASGSGSERELEEKSTSESDSWSGLLFAETHTEDESVSNVQPHEEDNDG